MKKNNKNLIIEKINLLETNFEKVLYNPDTFFMENLKTCSFATDDIEKYRYWEWTQGVGLFGLWKMYEYTGDEKCLKKLIAYYDERLCQGLPAKNINTMAPLLTLTYVYQKTMDKKYLEVCEKWAKWLMDDLPRTEEGGFQHLTSDTLNQNELWVDTLFMAVLFLARMAVILERKEYMDEAEYQFLLHIKYLYDKSTGLWFHGWTFEKRNNFANALWGRGNCWVTLAIPEFLQIGRFSPCLKKYLINALLCQIKALKKFQKDNGMWTTLIDNPRSYEEASATCGFGAGILSAINKGYINNEYAKMALKPLDRVLNLIDCEGILNQVSYGTPMGRDSKDFYLNIPICCMPYGQALGMLYLIECLKTGLD